jgi:hypothetical protein
MKITTIRPNIKPLTCEVKSGSPLEDMIKEFGEMVLSKGAEVEEFIIKFKI